MSARKSRLSTIMPDNLEDILGRRIADAQEQEELDPAGSTGENIKFSSSSS